MHERMTVAEAKRRFPDEHIAFIDYETGSGGEVLAGVLIGHAPEQRALRDVIQGHPKVAIFWTGKIVSPTLWALKRPHVVG